MDNGNFGRNPTKKRGRPPKLYNRHALAKQIGGGRNTADLINAINARLEPGLRDELLPLANTGETTLTILAAVARFPPEEQRAMFDVLNPLGSRGAKRYVECLTRPPTRSQMAWRIARWIVREFPALDWDDVINACELAAQHLQVMQACSAND